MVTYSILISTLSLSPNRRELILVGHDTSL